MRSRSVFIVTAGVVVAILLFSLAGNTPPPADPPPEEPQPYVVPQEQPGPAFEPNRGQAADDVLFVAHAPAPDVALTRRGARFRLPVARERGAIPLELELVGARPTAKLHGQDRQPGLSHYYLGNDPSAWITHVPQYGRVRYQGVYRGIDASFHGHDEGVEYDFVVHPGADPSAIRLRFKEARRLDVDAGGELVVETAEGTARQRAPFAFQDRGGRREPVDVRYHLVGPRDVALEVGAYDRGHELTIDPVLVFGTYIETFVATASAVAVDGSGYTYVVGNTDVGDNGQHDVLALKFAASGQLVYRTQLGGVRSDTAGSATLDAGGRVWIAGTAQHPTQAGGEFPRTVGAFQTAPGGLADGFFVRLGTSGALEYSSLLGGSGVDSGDAIALGSGGEVHVGLTTTSPDLPLQASLQPALAGARDFFLAKLDAAASTLLYSTYLGGTGDDALHDLGVAAAGQMILGGSSLSTDFPMANAVQGYAGGTDGVVARLDASGATLEWSTYFGGAADDRILGVAAAGPSVFVTGKTSSDDLPTHLPLATTRRHPNEGFLAKIDATGLLFSTYLDVNGGDDVALGPAGAVYLTGGGTIATKLRADLAGYDWFFGRHESPELLRTMSIAVDAQGTVAVAGSDSDGAFPTFNQTHSQQSTCTDCRTAIVVARIADAATPPAQHEQDAPAATYSGVWTTEMSPDASGGSLARSSDPQASVTISFTGTGIQIFGRRAPTGGRATASPDGFNPLLRGTSLYRDPAEPRALLFSITGLASGPHQVTLSNQFTGPSTAGDIWFDGFGVLTQGPVPTATPPASRPTWAPTVRPQPTPTPMPPPRLVRIEDGDPRITYTGNWYTQSSSNHSGGTARLAMDAGAAASFTFQGIRVQWYGVRDQWSGIAKIYLNGVQLGPERDTYSATEQTRTQIFSHDPGNGTHAVRIEVQGTRNPASGGTWVWLDYLEILETSGPGPTATPAPTATPTARPTVSAPTPTPTPTGAPTPGPERIEDGDARIVYSGTWYTNASPNANHSGGTARLAGDAGDTATLTFTGTGVKWLGLKDPWAGIARVFVDGTLRATVDTYSATEQLRQTLFTLDGLPAGSHTVRIEVTGTRNASSGGNLVWVDAFDITSGGAPPTVTPTPGPTATPTVPPRLTPTATPGPTATPTPMMATPTPTPTVGPTPGAQRIEDSDSRIVYAGTWYTNASPNANHSGGTSRLSGEPAVTATLTFTGTGVAWHGLKDPWAGIARVYVDGTLRATVDTYSALEQLRQVLFSASGLATGSHTIRIEATGTRHPDSGGNLVWFDAFDVTP